jgi:ribose/xylose/arabinose/galactoside ABC-type transport system permease subunit
MNKIQGILMLLVYICVGTALLSDAFLTPFNMQNTVRWSSLYGIIGIGVAFVIITGGIDLSIGSVIGLTGCILPMLLVEQGWSVPLSLGAVMGVAMGIGLIHGLLITKLALQPFVVTLCGLLIYRGLARWITGDQTKGFGIAYDETLRKLATGKPASVPLLLVALAVLMAAAATWQLIGRRRTADGQRRIGLNVFVLLAAIAIGVIGSSRFWYGFHVEWGNVLLSVGGTELTTWVVSVPPDGARLPRELMNWVGLAVFVPAGLVFLLVALKSGGTGLIPSLMSFAMSWVVLWLALRLVHMPDERFWPSAVWANRWRIAAAFFALGIVMALLAWFVRSALRTSGPWGRLLLTIATVSGILWLMGETPLGETLLPAPFFVLLTLAILAAVFLNLTIYGRYLLALGRNEEAARYSGINTDRMKVVAYVISSGAAGVGGILFALDGNSVQPSSHGNFYELYAIAAAVLGGCSLRGGEGTILGVVIGAAVMRVLYNSISLLGIPSQLEFAIIGIVILLGVIADEVVKRVTARHMGRYEAANR